MYNIVENVGFLAVPSSFPRWSRGKNGHADEVGTQEKKRQKHFINLIPSENFTSQAVLDALGSPMQSTFRLRPGEDRC